MRSLPTLSGSAYVPLWAGRVWAGAGSEVVTAAR
jgi:hypothetical protein